MTESSLKAIQMVVEGCNQLFPVVYDEELWHIVMQTIVHPKTVLCETGLYLCASLFQAFFNDERK